MPVFGLLLAITDDRLTAIGTFLVAGIAVGVVVYERVRVWNADKLRRKNMVGAWADWQEPKSTAPRLVALNVGPEIITDWQVYVCTVKGCSADSQPHGHVFSDPPKMTGVEYGALPPGVRVHPLESMPELVQGVGIRVEYIDPKGKRWKRTGPEVKPS